MSIEKLASRSEVGSNIYPKFLQQKVEFLDSEKGRFYYRGVFELEVLELLANLLEAQYFLDRENQKTDPGKLQRESNIIDDIAVRMNDEKYDYLLRNRKGTQADLNSVKLWRASILFVLDQRDETKAALQDLINENWRFIGQSADVGQAYIYKPLYFPYQIIVQPGKDQDGRTNFEIRDNHRVSLSG